LKQTNLMTDKQTKEESEIDQAVITYKGYIKKHRFSAVIFLIFLIIIPITITIYSYNIYYKRASIKSEFLEKIKLSENHTVNEKSIKDFLDNSLISDCFPYLFFFVAFFVFASCYKFHLKQICKNEYFLLGFIRIKVATENSKNGIDPKINQSLIDDAFVCDLNL
jgi:hypothetical protein